ncbi:MAG: 1-acyl-sn-glycerol-3-phosphate acyltransferase [Lishizhenia sp.]
MLYKLLKFLVGIGLKLYYKEIKVNGKHFLNTDKPLIIIANHPNTLMDAWVIGMLCNQPIHFMAKATLFNSSFKLKLLRSLNMIPINRAGEGRMKGVNNESSFIECFKVLEQNKTLVIFPEGTSYQERVLRKLKSGTARIALEAELKNNSELDLNIIALGLNYSQPEKFRSNILINIDAPQGIKNYISAYEKDKIQTARKLTQQFRIRLESVLVTSENKEEDQLAQSLYNLLKSKYIRNKVSGAEADHELMQEIAESLTEIRVTEPWLIQELKEKLAAINWKLQKLDIKADFLDRRFKSTMFMRQVLLAFGFIVIALPAFIFGLIHNLFQYLFTDWLVQKITKDVEYFAPISIFIGLFLYPIVYCFFLYLGLEYFGLTWLSLPLYFIAMPFSGLFAFWFYKYLKHIGYKWRYMLLMMDDRKTLEVLQKEKLEVKKILFYSH